MNMGRNGVECKGRMPDIIYTKIFQMDYSADVEKVVNSSQNKS